ncbi:hypothetical protein LshimejAT787_0202120 [Lyophyllum shimeji]|uniref:Uncharacterized protein n=1 Tax=Lyophyllum shimeji TaxID=47721 RepID=A0A9P3UIT7_LYOSH|nr:hypothetical protein LshimejAT787_0202120 [Lyophyllum shimeji]
MPVGPGHQPSKAVLGERHGRERAVLIQRSHRSLRPTPLWSDASSALHARNDLRTRDLTPPRRRERAVPELRLRRARRHFRNGWQGWQAHLGLGWGLGLRLGLAEAGFPGAADGVRTGEQLWREQETRTASFSTPSMMLWMMFSTTLR